MRHHVSAREKRARREAITFIVYDVILIALACISSDLLITLLCALFSAIAAIRAITLIAGIIVGREQLIEENFGVRINGSRD